ncbi:MAG: glycosyltransferase family 4 protein [Bacteroides sp.]|nr:glycosyltransferase family 4 protein [Bacteroides sp.]
MKIGIEAQRIFRPDKHGMDFVILEVLRRLQCQNDGHEYYVFVAPGENRCLSDSEHLHVVEVKCPTYPLWEQWALPRAVRRTGVDLLHCTSNTAPLYCPVSLVLTLHDIIFLQAEKPRGMSAYQQMGWYYRRWNVPRVINRCKRIITVSRTEHGHIVQRFPQLEGRLSVVHNGYSDCYRPLPSSETVQRTLKYLPEAHYLLCLGNTDPRKNVCGILRAYQSYLKHSSERLRLVITGLRREYAEELMKAHDIEVEAGQLVFPGYVPGEDLPALYNGARVFLFPSLQEGFGIPVLEAMACGTPVITSNCSSLPEVAGTDALLVNPHDSEEIASALLRLEHDDTLCRQLAAYGLEHVKQFSWRHTAEAYSQIYKEVL